MSRFPLWVGATSGAKTLLTNLELYYSCEDNAANSTVTDSHASYNGTIVNDQNNYSSEQSATGQINDGFDLDGSNDYIDVGSPLQSIFQGSFTISIWLNLDDGQLYQVPLGANDTGFANIFAVEILAGGEILWTYQSNSNSALAETAAAVFPNGATGWYHVVLVGDSTVGGVGGLKIYVGGSEETLDGTNDGDTSGVTFGDYGNSGDNLYIGCNNGDGTPGSYAGGIYDEIGVWSRALSGSEISELYNSGSGLGYPFTGGGANAPTGHLEGALVGALGGPI